MRPARKLFDNKPAFLRRMKNIVDIIGERILVLDGAMGTMIQRRKLSEQDFRGSLFCNHTQPLAGNNDILVLTRPDVVAAIHREYLEAGADIIETCTFNAQRISQAEYATAQYVRDINLAAARIARAEADRMTQLTPSQPRFVAGSIGPTGRTCSMSPDVENPAARAIDYDTLYDCYTEQIESLVEGGVDVLLVETVFDTLNAKAALAAARDVMHRTGRTLPVMLSLTIADSSGRILSGQTLEAVLCSVAHHPLLSIGLNCSFGAEQMLPFLKQLAAVAPYYVSCYPNAGLPDEMGHYAETPERMAEHISRFAEQGLVNIVGGCCGSTPDHIRAIARTVATVGAVRKPTRRAEGAWLAGLEGFSPNGSFVNVGERCNVAGSRKFLRLVKEHAYEEALGIARRQVADGAMVLDVNMDDAMIDAQVEMTSFLNMMASDPEVARTPWMIDSSRFEVIESALKCVQGKPIVNSLSLKEGEELFLERAARVRDFGAALVVMAFDEEGQATTFERKTQVCERAYRLLTERLSFPAEDIIFDPNILTVATGMREHNRYAVDFIEAVRWIKAHLPHAKVSGGVSNLSFAFRGNNYLREAMHAVFLYHAIAAGMDMAIVNPATSVMYADIPSRLLEALEDVILYRREDATERLLAIANDYNAGTSVDVAPTETLAADRRSVPLDERLASALQRGDEEFLVSDLEEAMAAGNTPSEIIEGALMRGMTQVGRLFGEGKMFLPQVVRTARTMKRAVSILQPYIERAHTTATSISRGRYLLATVKGDVHDIGKNIVSVVLSCNDFEVIDLGVMVSAEQIVRTAIEQRVDYIGLSGLITPSLDEMCRVAAELKAAGVSVPLFIGGATTSELHTAVKIAPLYDGAVFHVKDAAQNPILATRLAGEERERLIDSNRYRQAELRRRAAEQSRRAAELEATADCTPHVVDWANVPIVKPEYLGVRTIERISIEQVRPYINWIHFCNLWGVGVGTAEGERICREGERVLNGLSAQHFLSARVGFFEAYGTGDGIVFVQRKRCECCGGGVHQVKIATPRQRRANEQGERWALCDFVAPQGGGDYVGAFAVSVSPSLVDMARQLSEQGDDYEALLLRSVCDRLVEAASEWLHEQVRRSMWGYAPHEALSPKQMFAAAYEGIRPAVGYPSLPDQRAIFPIADMLDIGTIGIRLTENGAMFPQASVCGLYIASREARYFIVDNL